MSDRTILHVDCNSFFASVEMRLNPSLKNVPMAVCGKAEDRHGIVLAKNELAKRYGIVTAETIVSAKIKCPGLTIVEPHYEEYESYSRAVNKILSRFTEQVESFGIDECWLDVTASYKLFGTGEQIAEKIKSTIKEELGITVSIGVSFNKVFAKLGSDYKKPDAITVISRENYKKIVHPLPVGDLLFIGKKTVNVLNSHGIKTIGDLAECSVSFLKNHFGKMGEVMHQYANGEDESAVVTQSQEQKSISNGFTFRYDIIGFEACKLAILRLCESVGTKLRKSNLKCSGVCLKIKDVFLRTHSKQTLISKPSDVSQEISDALFGLLYELWDERKAVRSITVSVYGLLDALTMTEQLSIFSSEEGNNEKELRRESTIDSIREKYGENAILPLVSLIDDTGLGIK